MDADGVSDPRGVEVMEIRYLDNMPKLPQKRNRVFPCNGRYTKILTDYMASGRKVLVVETTLEERRRRGTANEYSVLLQTAKRMELPIRMQQHKGTLYVWRTDI